MNEDELMGKLFSIYVGEKCAIDELAGYYKGLKDCILDLKKENQQLRNNINKIRKILKEME